MVFTHVTHGGGGSLCLIYLWRVVVDIIVPSIAAQLCGASLHYQYTNVKYIRLQGVMTAYLVILTVSRTNMNFSAELLSG